MKKKKGANKKKPVKLKVHTPEPTDEQEKPFDFGGLPIRDLKKNLGCG